MKKIFTLFLLSIAINAFSQFTPGNLVVVRVGDGNAALSNKSNVINLVEMTVTGTVVQTITLPYTDAMTTGSNKKIVAQGSSSNDANLTVSANGSYFVLTGYVADTGIATISGVAGVKRVIARIAMDGTFNTTTLLDTAKSKGNSRCATTNDGTGFWQVGSTGGMKYVPFGNSGDGTDTAIVVTSTVTNYRTVQNFGGDIITGAGSGTVRVGKLTGFPTTSGNVLTTLQGIPATLTVNSIYMTSLPGGPAGLNTMYTAEDGGATGIKKWCLNSGTGNWDSIGIMDAGSTYRGMTGITTGSTVALAAVKGSSPLNYFVDATGYNVIPVATPVQIATAPTNTAFRGVQVVPVPLPIRLLSFNAAKNEDGTAKVWWVVNGDDNVVSYVVEKSGNGKDFSVIGKVNANGNNNYEFADNNVLTNTTYYRVKFVSSNGSSSYSNVVAVTPKKSIKLEIFPNPAQNNIIVSYPKNNIASNIYVSTLDGKSVLSVEAKSGSTQTSLDISKLITGSYIVTFIDVDGNKTSKTIIKQ